MAQMEPQVPRETPEPMAPQVPQVPRATLEPMAPMVLPDLLEPQAHKVRRGSKASREIPGPLVPTAPQALLVLTAAMESQFSVARVRPGLTPDQMGTSI